MQNHKLFNLLLLFSLLVCVPINVTAKIKVFTDRNPVRLNESFHLVFEVDNTVSGNPDFTPLGKDFDVLNQSQSSQINIINGQPHSSKQWRLTVIAKRAGNLTIPSIYFGNVRSTPSIITVQQEETSKPGQTNTDIFLEIDAEPKNPYVQSQVMYTVRLFYAININNASLSEPTIVDGEGIVEKLGEDAHYQTQRNGRRFQVLERKYAIFPQQSGNITIESLRLDAKISDGRRSRSSIFDDFGFLGQSRTHTKRLRSEAIALEVRAIPKTFTGQHWLPAKQLNLQENWSEEPPQFKAGEPATRTLILLADGLTAGQLPEFSKIPSSFPSQHQGELKQYPDKPKLEEQGTAQGVISRRTEKVAIIPSEAGNYTLPAIDIPWWNTKTDRMEIAHLAARTILVQPADNIPQQPMQLTPIPVQSTSTDTPIKTPIIQQPMMNHWIWLNFILAIGWLSTIIIWWRTTRKAKVILQSNTLNDKAIIKKLKQACYNNDLKQVKEALINFAQVHWQNHAPNSLGGIAPCCGEPLQTEIQTLNRLLYSQTAEKWQGVGLWKAFKVYYAQTGKFQKTVIDGLEPLYKMV